jgi:small subunit ribosomal protein S23
MRVRHFAQDRAYDIARREFYALRMQEDVDRRMAAEEARATGAYFATSMLKVGMELEDKQFERWKKWAIEEIAVAEQRKASMYTSGGISSMLDTEAEGKEEDEDEDIRGGLDEIDLVAEQLATVGR